MLDTIVLTGDLLIISLPLSGAIIPQVAVPQALFGTSANVRVNFRTACLQGDELPPPLRLPVAYTTPTHSIPGSGQLRIILLPVHLSRICRNHKSFLLKGKSFPVQFQVLVPAQMPTAVGPVPDPLLNKLGTGRFASSNFTVKAE